jgi:hypothetical protein
LPLLLFSVRPNNNSSPTKPRGDSLRGGLWRGHAYPYQCTNSDRNHHLKKAPLSTNHAKQPDELAYADNPQIIIAPSRPQHSRTKRCVDDIPEREVRGLEHSCFLEGLSAGTPLLSCFNALQSLLKLLNQANKPGLGHLKPVLFSCICIQMDHHNWDGLFDVAVVVGHDPKIDAGPKLSKRRKSGSSNARRLDQLGQRGTSIDYSLRRTYNRIGIVVVNEAS